jgi:hypothetical protein
VSSTVGSLDEDRLEAARQRGVLLDMLAVFVQRGRADAVQLAARQRGLQQVGGIHRAIGLAGADQRVHLVDEQDDLASAPAVTSAGRPSAAPRTRRDISRRRSARPCRAPSASCPSGFRHVAIDDAQREALGDGGLADAGLADQHRVVLGAAATAPAWCGGFPRRGRSPGSSLPLARRLGQVAGIFLQRVIASFSQRKQGAHASFRRVGFLMFFFTELI